MAPKTKATKTHKPAPADRGRGGRNLESERQWERQNRPESAREGTRVCLRLPDYEIAEVDSRALAGETRGLTIRRLLRELCASTS